MTLTSFRKWLVVSPMLIAVGLLGCDSGGKGAKKPGEGTPIEPTGRIELAASVESLPADGAGTSLLTATVTDAAGNPAADGTSVTFEIVSGPQDPGSLSADTVATTGGTAQVTYTAGSTGGTVQIRATTEIDGEAASSTVTIVLQGVVLTLSADPSAVQAGGEQTEITAEVRYTGGDPVPQGTVVTFETTLGILSASDAQTNQTGLATVTLTSSAAAGTATVTATALDATDSIQVSFTELPPTVNTIELEELESAEVGVLGSWKPQTSRIRFLAKDLFGDPVGAGYSLEFVILSGPGQGEQVFPMTAQTDSSGIASTVFTAGSEAGTVQIQARYRENPGVVSNAVVISISGGTPDGLNFGVWPELLNIAGRRFFGLHDPVTACPSDAFLNYVPDGTAVSFTTNYGKIDAGSVTTDGYASSRLDSQNPLPPSGRVTFQASTQSGPLARVLCVTPDPSDPTGNTLWVGTDGDGIYRSLDGGTTWLHVGTFANGLTNGIVNAIALDPSDTRIVYAGTNGGVFKSVGGGAWEDLTGWKRITGETLGNGSAADTDGASVTVYDLQYASTEQRARTRVYVDGVETTAYFYTDSDSIRMIGDHTGSVITIDYDLDLEFPSQYPVRALAIDTDPADPLHGSTIYAGTEGGGVYKSEDGGFTWSAANRDLSNQQVLSLVLDGSTLYAGTRGGVFRSADGGATWTPRSDGLADWVVQTLCVDSGALYAGTATRGIYWSNDEGVHWHASGTNVNAEKSTNGDVTAIVAGGGSLYAATREGGVFRAASTGGDVHWTPLTNVFGETLGTGDGETYLFTLANPSNQDKPSTRIYVDGENLPYGAYRFMDASTISLFTAPGSGTIVADYVREDYPSAFTYALAVAPDGSLFAGGNGRNLLKSGDAGASWTIVNGSAPHRIGSDVYATAKVVFSGGTQVRVLRELIYNPDDIAGADDLDGVRVDGIAYGAAYPVEYGGSETYLFTISDADGNPLVGGSSFTVVSDCGSDVLKLSGDRGDTIRDALRGETDYAFTATNVNDGDEAETCVYTLTVTSDQDDLGQEANGSEVVEFSQVFWAKLKVDPAESTIKPDESQKLTATGGSGDYAWTGNGTAAGENFFFVPPGVGVYPVVVRDRRTGEQATAYVTVKLE